jgi:hypothetical protein
MASPEEVRRVRHAAVNAMFVPMPDTDRAAGTSPVQTESFGRVKMLAETMA